MYRCVAKICTENLDFNLSGQQDIILNNQEKEIEFCPRILLNCGHSVCEKCIYSAVTSRREDFFKCDDCGKTTSFSQRIVDKIRVNRPGQKGIVRWNEDGDEDLQYEAFSIGAAFNLGRVSLTATPFVDLDENLLELPSVSVYSYRDEPEVISIGSRVSNASLSFKSAVEDVISMYRSCGKSLKTLFDTKTTVNRQYVTTKETIRKRFHLLHGLLQLEEDNLIRKLNKSKDTTIKSLYQKEKEIESVRSTLKSLIMRSPQYAHIQSNNPIKQEISSYRNKLCRVESAPEVPNYLSSLNKPLDELHRSIKKLVDFNKAVDVQVKCSYGPLMTTDQPASNAPTVPIAKSNRRATHAHKPVAYINKIQDYLVTIHDVKDSGYFSAYLPSSDVNARDLNVALTKYCNIYRHPPCVSKMKPGMDVILWHDQKKEWVRGKLKQLIDSARKSEKENYCFTDYKLSYKTVVATLTDYNEEKYETRFENLRESCAQLTDSTAYPKLLNVMKCRLKNLMPKTPQTSLRLFILKFCANNTKVRLLVQSEPVDGVYEVDVVHNIPDLVNPQPSLIEYLIYSEVAKLKDPSKSISKFPYQTPSPIRPMFPSAPSLDIGAVYGVDVTCIHNPANFYVVISREREAIEEMERKLNDLYGDPMTSIPYRLYYPRIYVPCAARCELFYDTKKRRGKIFHRGWLCGVPETSSANNDQLDFYAVDYGENIKVHSNDLRVLADSFVRHPKQAIECSLYDIMPADSMNWSQNAIKAFIEFFQASDTPTGIAVKSFDGKKKYGVVLTLHRLKGNHGNVNEILVEDGIGKKCSIDFNGTIKEENPLASRSICPNQRPDFKCCNLLQDIIRKAKLYNLNTIDSLVPIKVTAFDSPDSFYIQIATPEVQAHISEYLKRVDEEYSSIETNRVVGPMQGFDVGELCIYYYIQKEAFVKRWRRGVVTASIGNIRSVNNSTTDPRQMKQVPHDTIYKVRDRDLGIFVEVQRKHMLTLPPASPYRKDDDKCFQVFISGIKPIGESWSSESIIHCQKKYSHYCKSLFIKVDDVDFTSQIEKIPVDLIYKALETPNALAPSEVHYYSLRYDLIETGKAQTLSGELIYEKELFMDNDYSDIKIPQSMHDNSLLSSLKTSFYNSDEPMTDLENYLDPKRPEAETFKAVCTHVDDGLTIWFTIREGSSTEPTIANVNKAILQALVQKEVLVPFRGNADSKLACTVYNKVDCRWYRAEIISNNGNAILVRYVDIGLSNQHFIEELSSEIFCGGIPKLALSGRLFKCTPFSGRPDSASRLINYLKSNLVGKKIKITWENFGSNREMSISIFMEENNRDLKSILLNRDLIEESQESTEDYPQYIRSSIDLMEKSVYDFPDYRFVMDKFYPVIIGHYIEENFAYLQLSYFKDADTQDEHRINSSFKSQQTVEQYIYSNVDSFDHAVEFRVGDHCCAFWDGGWFRGIVSEVISSRVSYKVFFIDWGNSDVVEFTKMRILARELETGAYPIFGFFVRLSTIKPARQGIWTPRLSEIMKNRFDVAINSQERLLAKFKSDSMPFDVELWKCDEFQQPTEHFLSDLIFERYLEIC